MNLLRHRIGETNGASTSSSVSSLPSLRSNGGSFNNQHATATTITDGRGYSYSPLVSFEPLSKRRLQSCLTFPKCMFYTIFLVFVVVVIVGRWYNFNDIWSSDYSSYYHNNDNAYSLSEWLATRTMTTTAATTNTNTTTTTAFVAAASRSGPRSIQRLEDSSNIMRDHVVNDRHQRHKCAILFYGLPRSFRLLVLPSIIRNIIRPNAQYQCDYFVHFYDVQSYEAPSRSGYGGFINTSEILLLQQAVLEVEQEATMSRETTASSSRTVRFTSDTNASFWQYQNDMYVDWMHKIRTTKGKRRFIKQHPVDQHLSTQLLYLPVKDASYTFQTCENILKMWHSQASVYRLMQQQEQEDFHYTRVALFRSDVVYVTPIDIWKRVIVNATVVSNEALKGDGEPGGQQQQQRQHDQSPVLDVDNKQAVIPAFAKFPVNDRMFYGPAAAAKIWATQRLARLENHVHERILQLEPGFGMHSERYLYYTIFPAILNETQVEIAEDDGICLLRARADESVWINDCDSSSTTNKNSNNNNNNSRGTMDEYRAMIEDMIGRTCQQSRLPKEIHTRVIQLRCGLNETKATT